MKLRQPSWLRPLPSGLVVATATLGPLGARLPAPGTWGSAAGLLYYLVFFSRLPALWFIPLCLLTLYLAVAFCGEAELRLGESDPGKIILDEVVAIPLCFLHAQVLLHAMPHWVVLLAGFALFRFFDILKPLGIARLQKLPGGWGVVADDAAAALATCASLHLIAWIVRG
jgi:phosphatidylglycerophosphatase A